MESRTHHASTTVTMSSTFIGHLRRLLDQALLDAGKGKGGYERQGNNFYASDGAVAYLTAVAAVEAFVNEYLLSDFAQQFVVGPTSPIVSRRWLEYVEVGTKILLLPQLMFGKSLRQDEQPYQDFSLLNSVRNAL